MLNNLTSENEFDVYYGLAYELFDIDNSAAVKYGKKSHEIALLSADSLQIVKSGRITGQLYRRLDNLDEAISLLEFVLSIARRNNFKYETTRILTALAAANTLESNYNDALKYNFENLVINERDENPREIGIIRNNLGMIHYSIGSFEMALDYFSKSIDVKLKSGDYYDLDKVYLNKAMCYIELDSQALSRKFFLKMMSLCVSCTAYDSLAVEYGLGLSYSRSGDYYLAKEKHLISIRQSRLTHDKRYEFLNLIALVNISLAEKDLIMASHYLKALDSLAYTGRRDILMMDFLKVNAEYNQMRGFYKKAYFFQKKYSNLRDKIQGDDIIRGVLRTHAKFAEKENLRKIEIQSKNLTILSESIRRSSLLALLMIVILILSFVLVINLYKSNRHKRGLNIELDRRVRDRTIELERSRDALIINQNEREQLMKKMASELAASIATMRGLQNSVAFTVEETKERYYKEAEVIEEKIATYVQLSKKRHS